MWKAVGAAAVVVVLGAAFPAMDASAHGRWRGEGPVIVAPSHGAQPYPYWYYSRPHRRFDAPPVIVAPPPRHGFGAERRFHGPHHFHHSHRRPGARFEFRF